MKRCPRCQRELPRSDFHANKARYDSVSTYCKECNRKALSESSKTDKGKARSRRKWIKSEYGMSEDQYAESFNRQGGACAVCRLPNRSTNRMHIDHDHATGKFRGLLCSQCNTMLGLFGDSPDRLRSAASYADVHYHNCPNPHPALAETE